MPRVEPALAGGPEGRFLSLVEVADAVQVSYDFVYRDVRTGILPCRIVPSAPLRTRQRFGVTLEDLSRSARPCYRRLAAQLRAAEDPAPRPGRTRAP